MFNSFDTLAAPIADRIMEESIRIRGAGEVQCFAEDLRQREREPRTL